MLPPGRWPSCCPSPCPCCPCSCCWKSSRAQRRMRWTWAWELVSNAERGAAGVLRKWSTWVCRWARVYYACTCGGGMAKLAMNSSLRTCIHTQPGGQWTHKPMHARMRPWPHTPASGALLPLGH